MAVADTSSARRPKSSPLQRLIRRRLCCSRQSDFPARVAGNQPAKHCELLRVVDRDRRRKSAQSTCNCDITLRVISDDDHFVNGWVAAPDDLYPVTKLVRPDVWDRFGGPRKFEDVRCDDVRLIAGCCPMFGPNVVAEALARPSGDVAHSVYVECPNSTTDGVAHDAVVDTQTTPGQPFCIWH